ncbi:MAG TPA: hypothetical protein VFS92_04485, partial [Planctomycetota bacterium]|nr:hypothetical protein [Planctomycetota bacterium]
MPAIAPLRYSLGIESATRRLLRLSLEIPAPVPSGGIVLRLPAWSPGSYMIREYARHLERVEARDARGRALRVRREAKDRGSVAPPSSGAVRVAWSVYANELSVRSNHLDDTHAFV